MVSSMAEITAIVINQYFIWFTHLVCAREFLRFDTLKMIRVGHSDGMVLPEFYISKLF